MNDMLKAYKSLGLAQDAEAELRTSSQPTSSHDTNHASVSSLFRRHNSSDFSLESLNKSKREKCNKGLRHFSLKVCEKVKQKHVTTYNEVADELVHDFCQNQTNDSVATKLEYDQKNVKRRVYDALNVLMAMKIISKEKKDIKWIGLPCNKKQECQDLEIEKAKKIESIKNKSIQLREVLLEQIAYNALIERNKQKSKDESENTAKIKLPFIIVETDRDTAVNCNITNDKKDYIFDLNNTFQLVSHMDVLKKLGLTMGLENGNCTNEAAFNRILRMIPKTFQPYLKQMCSSTVLKPVLEIPDIPTYKSLMTNQGIDTCSINDFNDYGWGDDQCDESMDDDESDSEGEISSHSSS